MKVTLMLCDHAQVAGGKVFINGGGWTVAYMMRGWIAALFQIPWDRANHEIRVRFSLMTEDGEPIPFTDDNENYIELAMEVGRPPGLPRGTDLDVPVALELPTLRLQHGSYEWVLSVDDLMDDHWRLPFRIVTPSTPLQ